MQRDFCHGLLGRYAARRVDSVIVGQPANGLARTARLRGAAWGVGPPLATSRGVGPEPQASKVRSKPVWGQGCPVVGVTPARLSSWRITASVSAEKTKFIPRCMPAAMSSGVYPASFC